MKVRLVSFDDGDPKRGRFVVNPDHVVALRDVSEDRIHLGNTLIYLRDAPTFVTSVHYADVAAAVIGVVDPS
jgi:hypothetical protein